MSMDVLNYRQIQTGKYYITKLVHSICGEWTLFNIKGRGDKETTAKFISLGCTYEGIFGQIISQNAITCDYECQLQRAQEELKKMKDQSEVRIFRDFRI